MTAIQTTTTTETTTATQQGTQLVVNSQANTQLIGNFVTDVTMQPYIAPTIISFYASNMKPNCLLHVFFDSVNVDQYCAPGSLTGTDTSTYSAVTRSANWGTAVYSDVNGIVAGQFAVPAATFRWGDRVLELADVASISQGTSSITTQATSTFTASNLNVTKQVATLTTVNPVLTTRAVTNTIISSQTSVANTVLADIVNIVNNVITNTQIVTIANTQYIFQQQVYQVQDEPIAQALTIKTPATQPGLFATSLDLFFQQRSLITNNGVTVYLCETNNGYPDGSKILPFSQVHLPYSNIATSTNANTSTNFRFESPVFLQNDTEYAFIVKPDANDPDYRVWTANIGDVDVTTSVQVFSQPAVGTAFYGATITEWSPLQTEYIKFNLRRASFTGAQGDAYFNNANTDYVQIYNVTYANTTASMLPGDYVFEATSSSTATANVSRSGILSYYDSVKNILYIEDSTGLYTNNSFVQVHRFANATLAASPNSVTLVAYANTLALYNPILDAFVPQIASISPPGTGITWGYLGVSNAYSADATELKLTPGYETEFFDKERLIVSRSNEVASMASAKSLTMHASLTTDSSWLSPVIDTVRNQELVIANKVDPVGFNYNEFFNYSNTQSKYVSQIVTLAQGQDAEDLQISLTAHRPVDTDIRVFVKFLNGEDSDPISVKTWTPMINKGQTVYSDPSNPRDFREYNFVTPNGFYPLTTTGTITIANTIANVTGTSTLFGTDVKVGWWINMAPNTTFNETSRQIISITNTTFMTLNAPFTGNYTANAYYKVIPPTTASIVANSQLQLTGTVTISSTNNSVIGSGSSFSSQVVTGAILKSSNDYHTVISVTNTTYLTVDAPFLSTVAGANAFIVAPNGLSYLSSSNNLFSSFKQFQIKIVLQSNDTSKVPLLDDLRVLALQL